MKMRRWIAVGTAALALAASATAGAAELPADGAIVYSRASGVPSLAGGLFVVPERQLTFGPGDGEPAVSPDGRVVVFAREGDLYATRIDGSTPTPWPLTTGPEVDSHPSFFPSGRGILFERRDFDGVAGDLYVVSRTGSGSTSQLTFTPRADESQAAFSPDGRLIAYIRRQLDPATGQLGPGDVYSMRYFGGDPTALTRGEARESSPRYFAGGIVFNRLGARRGARVLAMRRDGREVRRVVAEDGAWLLDLNADGRRLLYRRGARLYVAGLRTPRSRPSRGRLIAESSGWGNPIFSPSGRRVATVRSIFDAWVIEMIDVTTGRSRYVVGPVGAEADTLPGFGDQIAWQPLLG
jgi:Tol biopolymer transport system component